MATQGPYPSEAAQQKICKRRDTAICAMAGPKGCEMCTPCAYTDAQLQRRGIDPELARRNHAASLAQIASPAHVCVHS